MKKTILVTGGLGYIGAHTVIELLSDSAQQYEVIIVDNLSNSSRVVYDKIREIMPDAKVQLYIEDVQNKTKMREIFEHMHIDGVIHFAGHKAVGESVSHPLKYYRNNLDSTLTLLELMEEFQVHRFIFSSSATVYGLSTEVPLKETLPKSTINPYAKTKEVIEDIITDVSLANAKLQVIALRYFNPLGAHESGEIGENPNGIPNNLAPYITQVAIGKLEKLSIFGTDYQTKDGTCIRDYVHVMDLAKGHVKALDTLFNRPEIKYEIVNLGSGQGFSVIDIIENFEKVIGKKIPSVVIGRRPGDIDISIADISKAKDLLDWQPKKTLEQMCQDSWRWQTKYPKGY